MDVGRVVDPPGSWFTRSVIERWHLVLAAQALVAGVVVAGLDRWAPRVVTARAVALAGLVGAVLGGWGNARWLPWVVPAALLLVVADREQPEHPLGRWVVALTVVSLVGVWSAVPDTEPPLAAACVLAPIGLSRLQSTRSVGPVGTAALVVAVFGAVWVGSAGWGAALATGCAVGMVLCAPLAVGIVSTTSTTYLSGSGGRDRQAVSVPGQRKGAGEPTATVRPTRRAAVVGAHMVVALVVPRSIMRLGPARAGLIAAGVLVVVVVVARAMLAPDRNSAGDRHRPVP